MSLFTVLKYGNLDVTRWDDRGKLPADIQEKLKIALRKRPDWMTQNALHEVFIQVLRDYEEP